jgi:hypothetical protein
MKRSEKNALFKSKSGSHQQFIGQTLGYFSAYVNMQKKVKEDPLEKRRKMP